MFLLNLKKSLLLCVIQNELFQNLYFCDLIKNLWRIWKETLLKIY